MMTHNRKRFIRASPDDRREALIAGTLSLIAEQGIGGATVRAIAERAEVTPGLIRHYFSTKEDLLSAAYARHMSNLTDATRRQVAPDGRHQGDAVLTLSRFVGASLRPPVVSVRAVSLWAGFLTLVQRDLRMRDTHARTYREFRDHLEELIGAALAESGRPLPPPRCAGTPLPATPSSTACGWKAASCPRNSAPTSLNSSGSIPSAPSWGCRSRPRKRLGRSAKPRPGTTAARQNTRIAHEIRFDQ